MLGFTPTRNPDDHLKTGEAAAEANTTGVFPPVYMLPFSCCCPGKDPQQRFRAAPWELLPSPLFLEQGRGSAPAEEPPGHGVSLPLAPPAQGTVGSLLSPGEQPGRARSHFVLLFATCRAT